MNTGMPIGELAKEITRQRDAKRDFLAPTRKVAVGVVEREGRPTPVLAMDLINQGVATFNIGDVAHGQIAEKAGIPARYYTRLKDEAPRLLAQNVNHWFQQAPDDEKRLIRVLDNRARALLSDRYRPLDNADLAEAAIPVLSDQHAEIVASAVTEKHMYLKAVDPKLKGYITRQGHGFRQFGEDEIVWGVAITNSEVGLGRVSVSTFYVRSVCTNGAIVEQVLGKFHLGGKLGAGGDDGERFFSSEARAADDRAFFLSFRDVVKGALSEAVMKRTLDKINQATGRGITGSVEKAVEVTARTLSLTEDEKSGVLRHLIEGADLSAWGLSNAVTRTAGDVKDFDRATELEAMGHRVVELGPADWREIAEAA